MKRQNIGLKKLLIKVSSGQSISSNGISAEDTVAISIMVKSLTHYDLTM